VARGGAAIGTGEIDESPQAYRPKTGVEKGNRRTKTIDIDEIIVVAAIVALEKHSVSISVLNVPGLGG
jgi:hypothetical protein